MNELFSIAGKVAVITGAGGVLGGNIAQHFVQQGAKVVAIDIRQEQLDNRVAELKTIWSGCYRYYWRRAGHRQSGKSSGRDCCPMGTD